MELLVESLEGDIYLAYQVQGDSKTPFLDHNSKPMRFHSLEQIRSHCEGTTFQSASLRQNTAYDEMCGSNSMGSNIMVIDLNWY
ncbi:hypothetical protein JCM19231_3560 [Vibrio ishigakensis]|uniref:Uncharacterized protein n=1 Tax=Vibrio ishigakensis TaxID=1481914 RepID=A0A0B8NGZ9_9VIBR|nr:DUF6482 family protein [Vibrio ishigakensis]GAM54040.1 hypothetical protein JCM19231_3560 [Vibrio ishigakensis]